MKPKDEAWYINSYDITKQSFEHIFNIYSRVNVQKEEFHSLSEEEQCLFLVNEKVQLYIPLSFLSNGVLLYSYLRVIARMLKKERGVK